MIEPSLGTTAVTYVPYIISVLVLIFFLFMYLFLVFSDIHTLMASTLPRNTGIVEICTVIHALYRQRTPPP